MPTPVINQTANICDLMQSRLTTAESNEEWLKFRDRVATVIENEFYGTFCRVEVTGVLMQHQQMLCWLYRRNGWFVENAVTTEPAKDKGERPVERCWLVFRDPASKEQRSR